MYFMCGYVHIYVERLDVNIQWSVFVLFFWPSLLNNLELYEWASLVSYQASVIFLFLLPQYWDHSACYCAHPYLDWLLGVQTQVCGKNFTKRTLTYHFIFKNPMNLIAQLKTNVNMSYAWHGHSGCHLWTVLQHVSLIFLLLLGFVLGLWWVRGVSYKRSVGYQRVSTISP